MSGIKSKVKKIGVDFINSSSLVWNALAVKQLSYKFQALRAGIASNQTNNSNLFNLRRNIHRLEKGLSYASVKGVFAADYILPTVMSLKVSLANNSLDNKTKTWAISVLNLYFEVVSSENIVVQNAKNVFFDITQGLLIPREIPYASSERPTSTITYEELHELSVRRRSVRHFSDEPVDINTVMKAYEIAKYAPSACNRQAFQFLFFNDPATVNKLSKIPGGVAGYVLPSLIVVLGRYDGYFDVRDINAPVIDSSLAIMSFLYAAETLGLGTVCVNWPNLLDREAKIREIIDIKPYEFVVMLIGLGYPLDHGKIPFSGKRPSDHVVLFNERIKK